METWYALTHAGAEPALVQELADHGIQAEPLEAAVTFSATKADAAALLYHIQCATRLLLAVDDGPYDDLDPAKAQKHIDEKQTFRVQAETLPTGPSISSQEVQAELGADINRAVDLDDADITVYCQAASHSVLGIDIAGDLSKRYYRVFTNSISVKGTIAAAIHWLFDTTGGLLDPFANTGEIMIEAAFKRTNISPLKYRKHQPITLLDEYRDAWTDEPEEPEQDLWCIDAQLGNLRSCKKNAKLAGVEKAITFSKYDPEWMDVKFDENEVSCIVTIPPPVTNRNPSDDHIKELCYQAEWILKKSTGRMIVGCLTANTVAALAEHAKAYKFRLTQEHVVYSGQLPIHVMCYEL